MILIILFPVWFEDSKFSLERSNDNLVVFIFIIVYIGNANGVVIKLLIVSYSGAPPLLGLKY